MFFSISPQSVALPGGQTLDFRVNPSDSSICEIHIATPDGVVVKSFKRNGISAGPDETFAITSTGERKRVDDRLFAGFRSVDEDPVRGTPRRFNHSVEQGQTPQDARIARGDAFSGDPRAPKANPNQGGEVPTVPISDGRPGHPMETKTSPVHGKINTAGADNNPGKPPEGRPPDAPRPPVDGPAAA